jgi:hypothetical protein
MVGYENGTTVMNYTQPELLQILFPMQYGKTTNANFEGIGEYSRMLPLSVKGEDVYKLMAKVHYFYPM